MSGYEDVELLEWSSANQRIILTHDVRTMIGFAQERIRAGLPMPGIVVIQPRLSVGQVIDDLQLLVECSQAEELEHCIQFLPFS